MKKIMFLGGARMQLPAIQYAKEQGYYSILCDYLPGNPGQFYADEYYCISTTDKEAVLEVAKQTKIDGIVAYISDTAAPTAAYVAHQLKLPSNPYKSVLILSQKDLFRSFLREHGFNCPRAVSFAHFNEARREMHQFQFPLMVKPTDSSGSRGVSQIHTLAEFEHAFEYARLNSKGKRVIVEEFIQMDHDHQIGGDVFVIDGKLEFCELLNCHRNKQVNPYIPVGKSFPLFLSKERVDIVRKELQRVIDLLSIKTGALNIEMIFGKDKKPYIIEIAPRNGGNLIPNFLELITGVDFVKATVESALGNQKIDVAYELNEGFYSIYTLHSADQGKLVDIVFNQEIEENIVNKLIYKKRGSEIEVFTGGNKAIGFVFLKFGSLEELKYKMNHMDHFIDIQVI